MIPDVPDADLPLVSVLIPSFQRAHTLPRAIDAALGQTYPHLEVVLVDTGSTDGTATLIDDLAGGDERLRAVHLPDRLGPTDGWRACLERSRGELIKWLWSDDWLDPDTVEILAAPLLADPELGFTVATFTIHEPGDQPYDAFSPPGRVTLDLAQMLRHHCANLLWGHEWLTVSPGASLQRRADVEAALDAQLRRDCPECWERAIGPDLYVQWWALRSGRPGLFVPDARAHFWAGDDSISIATPRDDLFGLYRRALFLFLGGLPAGAVDDRTAGHLAVYRQLSVDHHGPFRPDAQARAALGRMVAGRGGPNFRTGEREAALALGRSLSLRARRFARTARRRAARVVRNTTRWRH